MNRLQEILSGMDIPEMRRDTTSDSNIRWLLRNLPFRNAQHPQFREAMNLLRDELSPAFLGE